MNKNTSLLLGEHFAGFIDTKVMEGRYSSASDVMRAALRLLEEHETKVSRLQSALIAGEESGLVEDFDSDAFLAKMHKNHAS